MKEKVDLFLNEYEELCKKYDLSLGHEDCEGGFIIDVYRAEYVDWVRGALLQWELDEEERKRHAEMVERIAKMEEKLQESIGEGNIILNNGVFSHTNDGNSEYVRDLTDDEKKLEWSIDVLWMLLS